MQYQTLYNSELLEVRKYPPIKRTITVCGRQYFLQFPSMLFARTQVGTNLCKFYVALCDDENSIYVPPLSGCVQDYSVCLDSNHHYSFPLAYSFDNLLRIFWQTDFGGIGNGRYFGRLHDWCKKSLEEILDLMKKSAKIPTSIYPRQSSSENKFISKLIKESANRQRFFKR